MSTMSIERRGRPTRPRLSNHRVLAGTDRSNGRQRQDMASAQDLQPILSADSQQPQEGTSREVSQARVPELCESKTMLLLSQLRLIRPVSFPAISKEDQLRWPTLIAWLQDTLAQCEADFKQSISERRSDRAAKQSVPLQEAIGIMKSLKALVRMLPSGVVVQESDRLCLHQPANPTTGGQSVLLDTANSAVADLQNQRAEAAAADLLTGKHGYKAMLIEMMELGIIDIKGKHISLPDSPGQWQSTLDGLESKLMSHSRRLDQDQLQLTATERRIKFNQVIRLRGWIVSARRQHAGTMQRGFYYRPDL